MSPLKFCPYFASDILQELWKQRESESFCDVVLIAGTEKIKIPAHSCVLSAASEYFNRMFASSLREGTTKAVEMPTVDCDILQLLVQYCYTGLVEISEDHVVELLRTAEMLLFRNVVTICANRLAENLDPSNCLGFVILAEQHRCETLLQKAKDYSLKHFVAVRKTEQFLNLNAAQFSELLSSDHLNVSSEEEVLNAFKNWINFNLYERKQHQAELLKLVRLPLLGRFFLKQHVKPICTSMDCLQVYTDALEQDLTQQYILQNERCSVKSKQFLMGISITIMGLMDIRYYCTQRLKWMKLSKNLKCRWWAGVAFVGNSLFLVGGQCNLRSRVLKTVLCLNLKTMNLVKVRPMLEHRRSCSAAVLNGFLYVVGGENKDRSDLNSVQKWNPNTDTWSKVASMAVGRSSFGLAVLNEKLYAVGGYSSSNEVNSAECFDPVLDVWMPIASMHKARQSLGLVVCKGLLYAVGGHWNVTVESYNPDTNCWTMLCSLNDCSIGFQRCGTFRNRVIVFHSDCVEEYDEGNNAWNRNAYLKVLENNYGTFAYSGELLTTEFVEN